MTDRGPSPSRRHASGRRLGALAAAVLAGVLVESCGGDSTGPGSDTPAVASVEVKPDSTSLLRGSTVQLSATARDKSGTTLPGSTVTWSSSDAGVATVSSTGLVTGVDAGHATVTATSEGHSGSAVVVVAGGAFDHAIVDARFTQGVQDADGSLPMVLGGNGAVLNVLVSATPSTDAHEPLVLRLLDAASGSLVFVDTTTTTTRLGAAPGYDAPSAQFLVPPSVLRSGLTWQVARDAAGTIPDDSAANDVFPRGGPALLATVDVPTLKVRFIPIVLSANGGATGNVAGSNLDEYTRVLLSVYPLGSVDVQVGAPFTTSASFGTPPRGGESPFWLQVLQELDLARVADPGASDAHWYGVVRPPTGFNYTYYGGYGYIPGSGSSTGTGTRTALSVQVGWFSVESQARDLVAHELGHNFGRQHSPCGNPSGVDPNYPFPGGDIGLPGHDAFAWTQGLSSSAATISAGTGDVMGYCHPVWASAYTWKGVLDFRAFGVAAEQARTRVLFVRGVVDGSGVRLEPAFSLEARPSPVEAAGSYQVEGLAGDGSTLFRRSFDPAVVDHAPDVRTFAVAVPLTADLEDRLETLRVRGPAGEAVTTRPPLTAPSRTATAPPTVVPAGNGFVRVTCGGVDVRGILVQDAAGHVLASAPGFSTEAATAGATSLVVACSDGVHTTSHAVIAP